MILRDLNAADPRSELWWDSLPDTREYWRTKLAAEARVGRSERVAAELSSFFDGDPASLGAAKGATTNPSLVWQSVSIHAERWRRFVLETAEGDEPTASVYWRLYKTLFESNAVAMRGAWESSGGRFGWVCAQVLPATMDDAAAMASQGAELAALGPNVMVKLPSTGAGFAAMEALVARGASVNATLSFTVSQTARAADAVRRGREIARRRGVDLSRSRAVATFMMGRLGAERELARQAAAAGVALTAAVVRSIELLVFREASRVLTASGAPVKLLASSLRMDRVGGAPRCLHLEGTAGTDCIVTLPPSFLSELFSLDSIRPAREQKAADCVPEARLLAIPYVREACEADAPSDRDYAAHPAFAACREFAETGYGATLDFIERIRAGKVTTGGGRGRTR